MKRLLTLGLVLAGGLAVGAGVCLAGPPAGADPRPIKIDFVWKFDIKYGPSYMVPPNLPPWYVWFPNEPPAAVETAQMTRFPNWPQTWPPAGNPGVPGAPPRMPARSQAPYGGDMMSSGFQPTGFQMQPQQAPGYWYGR